MTKKIKKSKNLKQKKKHPVFDVPLDTEEQELMDSIDRGEWKPVPDQAAAKAFAKKAADNYFRKEARITLRLTEGDLYKLQEKAAFKGLPYQTFIASILHEYVEGHFIEKAA